MDDGHRHPINLRNENQEEPHHFKNKINYTHQNINKTSRN